MGGVGRGLQAGFAMMLACRREETRQAVAHVRRRPNPACVISRALHVFCPPRTIPFSSLSRAPSPSNATS